MEKQAISVAGGINFGIGHTFGGCWFGQDGSELFLKEHACAASNPL
jgi:hypothetical protein